MKFALIITTCASALMLYIVWSNGLFLRCPHCRKIGSWHFDAAEPAVYNTDEDGVVQSSYQIRICRKCGKQVLHRWSDHEGRAIEKMIVAEGTLTYVAGNCKLTEIP